MVFSPELEQCKFVLQADNTATLQAAMDLKSGKPLMNAMAGEVALRLDRLRSQMAMTEHIPGLLNIEADALSRLSAGKELPASLRSSKRFKVPLRDSDFWMCWPQEL